MRKINVLIVDDHHMIRDGIRTMLSSQVSDNNYVIDDAETIDAVLKKIKDNNYDIVLMDYQLPVLTGAELTKRILTYKPEMKILAISGYDDYSNIKAMMDAGACGYLLKVIGPTELNIAIESVLNGDEYYTREIRQKLQENSAREERIISPPDTENYFSMANVKPIKARGIYFTKREKQVVCHLAKGRTSEAIAKILKIKKGTVDGVRSNLLRKLNVKNTASILQSAIELRLINTK